MTSARVVPTPATRSARMSRAFTTIELPSLPLLGRYSVTKFLALQEYLGKATPWRTLSVLLSIPLPALAMAILPAFLPLRPPREGPNWAFVLHGWLIILAVSTGNMLSWIAVTQIPHSIYSPREALVVGVCCATLQAGAVSLIYEYLCFPVPFMFVSCFGLWATNLFLANVIVLRSKIYVHRAVLLATLRKYSPCWCVQMTQITIYPTFSIIFDRVTEPYQILLTLLFPIIKRIIRYVVKKLARELRDHSGVVSVSSVEICASVYQSMIMQSAPSQIATALVMGIDLIQGLFSIKVLMDRPTAVPRHHANSLAQALAQQLGEVLAASPRFTVSRVDRRGRQRKEELT